RGRLNGLTRNLVVAELHDVVEIPLIFVDADLEDVDKPLVQARNRLIFSNAGEFSLERALIVKGTAVDDLDGPIYSHLGAAKHDLPVTAPANATQQFVLGDDNRRRGLRPSGGEC